MSKALKIAYPYYISVYQSVLQLLTTAHCDSKPSQALIGKFDTACMLRILWSLSLAPIISRMLYS